MADVGIVSAFILVVALPLAIWVGLYSLRKKIQSYNLDPMGMEGTFEPLLQKYLHLTEFMIGLATGSIVLLVGSSVLHGKDGHLPKFYRPPLLLLAASVLFGLVFMATLILSYEEWQHNNRHTALAYASIETFGYSCLILFVIGYIWLIWAVTI
jgi:hypothetical protein